MAAQCELVLSEALCFIVNKYVKVSVKQLKSILVDFYSVEALSEAKVRLLTDTEATETPVKPTHVARRRDGNNKIVRDVDDIITLIQCLDKNKLLRSLPIYVSANPDCMPCARLFEGDLNMLMVMFEKMGHKVDEFGSALATITRDVGTLQSKFVA